jgi:hypothetical protein
MILLRHRNAFILGFESNLNIFFFLINCLTESKVLVIVLEMLF